MLIIVWLKAASNTCATTKYWTVFEIATKSVSLLPLISVSYKVSKHRENIENFLLWYYTHGFDSNCQWSSYSQMTPPPLLSTFLSSFWYSNLPPLSPIKFCFKYYRLLYPIFANFSKLSHQLFPKACESHDQL